MQSSVVAEGKPGCTEGLHCIELLGEEEVAEDNVPRYASNVCRICQCKALPKAQMRMTRPPRRRNIWDNPSTCISLGTIATKASRNSRGFRSSVVTGFWSSKQQPSKVHG